MTEYGAPITTSETYCRDTAGKATHSVLVSGKPGLQGGREGPGSQLGQGNIAGPAGEGNPQTPQEGTETVPMGPSHPPPASLRLREVPLPAHSPGRPARSESAHAGS